ncbi:MAG TPA: AraC family transcriptional regulator ligand-binding domain-containing protein [Kofleriaceae bacterium]|nr:AraC family transcriptional regulator ligand-binding domain-containing protein [Kofleriaceae bacterium]
MYDLPGPSMRDLVELTKRWQVAPAALVDGLPLTLAALDDPTTRVPLRVCEAMVRRAHELTREPALAVHYGLAMRLSSHGFLGFAAMTAATVREALELAVMFASTRTSAIGLALYVEGDRASIVIEERAPLGALREFSVIALMIGLWQIGQALTGSITDGICECAFAAPAYVRALPLADRLVFDRPSHRMVFAAADLELRVSTADPAAMRLARSQLERELAAIVEAGLPGKIRSALATSSSEVDVARALSMSPRTLKRRLAEHDTTFSAIRDDVRLQRALLLLDDRTRTIGEIATLLGYTELPNFTRAFRKWTGMTPNAYRGR